MKTTLAVIALLLSGSCLATAANVPPRAGNNASVDQTAVAAADQPEKEDRMVCERKKRIGSNRIERICMTESQREAARERARNDLQRLGASGSASGGSL